MQKEKNVDWLLLIILVLGGIVRFWGINFGLPHQDTHPDEWFIVYPTVGFFSGDLNPHNFSYPSFFRYILLIGYCIYFLIGKALGRYSSVSDFVGELVSDPTNFYLISRSISALLGTATIIVVYKISRTLFNREIALIASLFLSLAFLHVRDSHFGMTDTSMIFLLLISLFFIIKSYYYRSIKNYALSGFWGGLAMSTKYNALLLAIPILIVHSFNIFSEKNQKISGKNSELNSLQLPVRLTKGIYYGLAVMGVALIIIGVFSEQFFAFAFPSSELATLQPQALERAQKVFRSGRSLAPIIGCVFIAASIIFLKIKLLSEFLDKRIILFISLFIGSFFLGTPFAIVEFLAVIYGFLVEAVVNMRGKGVNLGIGWWYYGKFVLPLGLGWALFLAALIGAFLLIRKQPKKAAILLAFPLVYYVLVGKGVLAMVRYMTPVIPFACITASIFVVSVRDRISEYISKYIEARLIKTAIVLFLTTIIIFQSAYTAIQFDGLISKKDNRLIAEEWVREHVPMNSSIYQTGAMYGHLNLYPLQYLKQQKQEAIAKNRIPWSYLFQARIDHLKKTNPKEYEEWEYDRSTQSFKFNNQVQNTLPDYIIRQDYPVLVTDTKLPEEIEKALTSFYKPKQFFEVIRMDNHENWFDQADAFYLPFSGFKDVQRPGPNLSIYERIKG